MSDVLAGTDYANEYYLRHLLKEDRLPGFQGQKKKGPGCGELLRNDQRICILHPSKETDTTVHQSGGNTYGESNDLCCNRRVLIKTTKARRGKSDIVFRCLGSEGWKYIVHKHTWVFAIQTFLLPMCSPFPHMYTN